MERAIETNKAFGAVMIAPFPKMNDVALPNHEIPDEGITDKNH
jgi:hypothetical protein